MLFRFNVGDEAFVTSRYDGIQRVNIVAQIEYKDQPHYELAQMIQINKDGDMVGSSKYSHHEGEYIFPDHTESPCPESMLFLVGDPMRNAMSNLFGGTTQDIFTQEMANNIK